MVNLLLGGCLFTNHTCIMETTGFNVDQAYTLNGHIFHWLAARGNTNYPCFFAFCRWGCITRQIKWVEHCVQKCYKKQVWNKNMRIGIYIDAYRRQGLTYPGFLNLEMWWIILIWYNNFWHTAWRSFHYPQNWINFHEWLNVTDTTSSCQVTSFTKKFDGWINT